MYVTYAADPDLSQILPNDNDADLRPAGLPFEADVACDYRPHLFVTGDRARVSANLMFASSDRTPTVGGTGPLIWADATLFAARMTPARRVRSLLTNSRPGSGPMIAVQTVPSH
jgi:hypothetical protein